MNFVILLGVGAVFVPVPNKLADLLEIRSEKITVNDEGGVTAKETYLVHATAKSNLAEELGLLKYTSIKLE